ncbi:MAG TPA: sigma-54 dependent transcriptional regulator, partial [Thermodesulfovibrionales bacterium]|nr:sigma-54 dependent transcriptional regulator [Thermodesulfovibrionales bacterium]
KKSHPAMEVMIVTGFGSIDAAVEAMKKGAFEYITKPFNLDELILKVKNIHERKILKTQNLFLRTFLGMHKGVSVIARSQDMQKIMNNVEGMKDSDCNVLLTGETGVGKGLLAKIIHFTSRRQNMPFLAVHCTALSEEALASEIFGHEEGAFPGAESTRKGLIEISDSGTLFIDDITEMSSRIQTQLLKVVEEGEFSRAGGKVPIRVNVRFIAATHQNMREQIAQGTFREDLYHRLNIMDIFVPPLRERKEDIEPLCTYILQKHLSESTKKISGFTQEALDILMGYSFPGNVRELENIIERAIILEQGTDITPQSLPVSIKKFRIDTFSPEGIKTIDELTKDYTTRVLEMVDGDKRKAAALLGISEITLWRILKE